MTKVAFKYKMLLLVILVMVLQGIVNYINFKNFSESFVNNIHENFQANAKNIGQRISAQFYERYGDVQAFAMNPDVYSMNGKVMEPDLDKYVSLYGLYDLILVVDKNGKFVGANTKAVDGRSVNLEALKSHNYKNEDWFKKIIAQQTTDDKKNGLVGTYFEEYLEDKMIEKAFGKADFGSSFSAPIKNNEGETIGVITNRAGKRWIENELSIVHKNFMDMGYADIEMTVFNKDGLLISYVRNVDGKQDFITDPKRILNENFLDKMGEAGKVYRQKSDGYVESKSDDGEEDVIGFHKLNNSKWVSDVAWGVMLHDSRADAFREVITSTRNFYFLFFAALFVGIVISVFISIALAKNLTNVTKSLSGNSDQLIVAAKSVSSVSVELSESATEQAAAIQETMAAVDEISAMVEKNAESARRSQELSQQSKQAAERGQNVMSNMLTAIDEIDQSNEMIANQIDESNRELTEITKLIGDIENKTKVINEIVFQTKLLSFNASVEAARAGEYGKGFSVVAEEVGNLAQMSGGAAKEITTLLNESVLKVNTIVANSKQKVDKMISSSKDKVKYGANTAKECTDALGEILENVQTVDSMVSEIAVASTEQSTGIREVSKAVAQMEQVTQKVATMANGSSASSEQLSAQAVELNDIVRNLALFVDGRSSSKSNSEASSGNGAAVHDLKNFRKAPTTGPATPEESIEFKKVANADFVPSGDDPGFKQ